MFVITVGFVENVFDFEYYKPHRVNVSHKVEEHDIG